MNSSWFPSPSYGKGKGMFTDTDKRELPRWRSPSPLAQSIIPPPIVQSTHVKATPHAPEPAPTPPVVAVDDRQIALEADLQYLLDAQADGLVQGLDGGGRDDQSATTGIATPTINSLRSTTSPAINPVRSRKIGLKRARRGIHNTIIALSGVKKDELEAIDLEVQERNRVIAQLDEWEEKRHGLRKAAKRVDDTEEVVRAQRLRKEADTLQVEINNVELQLAEMKARHRNISREAAASENAVQAKLASYSHSLDQLTADIQKFLSLQQPTADYSRTAHGSESKSSVWALPPRRRNLALARQELTEGRDAMIRRREEVEQEKSALREGATVWRNVLQTVEEFEAQLRKEMADISSPVPASKEPWQGEPRSSVQGSSGGMNRMLQRLSTVIEAVEKEHQLAENKGWKLMVAAIGAELYALRQGKEVLINTTGEVLENEDDPPPDLLNSPDDAGSHGQDPALSLQSATNQSKRLASNVYANSVTDEDPDPELMFSRQGMDDQHT